MPLVMKPPHMPNPERNAPGTELAPRSAIEQAVMERAGELLPEMVEFAAELVRIPTVNPPGEHYEECARFIGERYARLGYGVEYVTAEGSEQHSARYPRVNVLGRLDGRRATPCVHFNGHLDVAPAGDGWSEAPFGGAVRDGKLFGRGACDMKAGLAASLYAVEALRRAGVRLEGSIEQSATVDEESGGFAGAAWLAERGYFHPSRQQHVIIPEPLGAGRVCLGHRGVYWFEVTTHGRIAHGSMPFLGVNAIDLMQEFLAEVQQTLRPRLAARRTGMPVEPPAARFATLNLNSISGGQPPGDLQTPCVADRCSAVFDRRFLFEEDFAAVRQEVVETLEAVGRRNPAFKYELRDRMVVYPTFTPAESPLAATLAQAIEEVSGAEAEFIASPGTYDQKHFVRIGGVKSCVAYGPGILDLAHQPDEYVRLDHMERAAKVMALAALRLAGGNPERNAPGWPASHAGAGEAVR